MCSKVFPILSQGLSILSVHSYSSVSTEGNTTQSVCHTAPTSDKKQIHNEKPGGLSEAPMFSFSSVTLWDCTSSLTNYLSKNTHENSQDHLSF